MQNGGVSLNGMICRRYVFRIQLGESELAFTRKLVEKKIDPARGEYYVPVQMLPCISCSWKNNCASSNRDYPLKCM